MHRFQLDDSRVKPRVVASLYDDQGVARIVFRGYEPRCRAPVARPAHAESLALPQRMVGEPAVLAEHAPVGRFDRARLARKVAGEKIAKRPLADEADAGRISLGEGRNTLLACDRAYRPLGQFADRKHSR